MRGLCRGPREGPQGGRELDRVEAWHGRGRSDIRDVGTHRARSQGLREGA